MSKRKKIDVRKFDKAMRPGESGGEGLTWHSPKDEPFQLAGFAWFETDGVYRVDPKLKGPGTAEMKVTSTDPRLKGIGADAYEPPKKR